MSEDGAIKNGQQTISPDELIELVRAVKFAHHDMSMKNVHKEITTVIASNDAYEFLQDVKLNDVKKVWKKALKAGPPPSGNDKAHEPKTDRSKVATTARGPQDDDVPPPQSPDGVIRFYTVGDGSVKTLAQNYSKSHAEAAARQSEESHAELERERGKYTSFFLNVPADMSGQRPHQALINYNRGNKGGKKVTSKKKTTVDSGDGRDMFKIQMAAPVEGMDDVPTPMLLYNKDRTARTFLHPPSGSGDEEDDGYQRIRRMIRDGGASGVLGSSGGTKAYFHGFVSNNASGPDVVSIDTSDLCPTQDW
mmetsp:Transcript_13439/g.29255  ORF Transcript_13439/g.29255 Transcript_13439/m.29255 type:complete len:307 (-) Transcript_13439:50-970(-)